MASDTSQLARQPHARPGRAPSARQHFRALDGIRALAVIAVLLYHFGVPHSAGGFLGVDLFFVLSGYLITSQLMTRWVSGAAITGHSFATFWAARARRLFPPLAALLVGTSVTVAIADRAQLSVYRGDVAAAAGYVSNWWYIFHERSYFVASGRPPMLQHLWSLAVEEQFYLVWPVLITLVVLLVKARRARRGALLVVALGLMTASALVMGIGSALAHVPEAGDPSRWYFGTDSHAVGLLAGAAVAIWRGGDGLGGRTVSPMPIASRRTTWMGFAALAAILVILSQTAEFSTWLYRYGFLVFSLLAAALIVAAVQRGPLEAVLGTPVLTAIGRRSYSMYLWHWPVACMTRPGLDISWPAWQVFLLRVGLTLALTEASYRLIETPIRRHGWRAIWRRLTARRLGPANAATLMAAAIVAVVVAISLPAGVRAQHQDSYASGVTYVRCTTGPDGHRTPPADAPAGARCVTGPKKPAAPGPAKHTAQTPRAAKPSPAHPSTGSRPSLPPRPAGMQALQSEDLVVYGDSVPLGAMPQLTRTFATVANHAVEGEQAWDLLPEMIKDADAGMLRDKIVLLHTGDNGLIPAGELDRALTAARGAKRIIVATPHTPKQWEQPNVETVRDAVSRHDGVVLLDWNDAVEGRDGWLWDDGIHLDPQGRKAYNRLVASAALRR